MKEGLEKDGVPANGDGATRLKKAHLLMKEGAGEREWACGGLWHLSLPGDRPSYVPWWFREDASRG